MNKVITVLVLALVFLNTTNAQNLKTNRHSVNQHSIDRLDIMYNVLESHSALQAIYRYDIYNAVSKLQDSSQNLDAKSQYDIQHILVDNNDWQTSEGAITSNKPFLKHFYKTPGQLYELNEHSFGLKINPILNLSYGKDSNKDQYLFNNQRGIRFRGHVDNKVWFDFNLIESQSVFTAQQDAYIEQQKAIPGNGFYKPYNSDVFKIENGYDFLNATGTFGLQISKHVSMQLGHDKHFIGNGIRSLLLSDFSNNYFFLRLNTQVGKLHYQNIFAELQAISANKEANDLLLPKKYMAAHYLSFKPHRKLEIGLFESVIFERENHFEFQYLNPVILFRTVEQGLGSPDNVLLGLNGKWNILNTAQVYGQLMLDEFKLDELIANNGWWANKYAIQAGAKYINAFKVNHLDLQAEANIVRPYTYTHRDSVANYTHYGQTLAHPLGANFIEILLKAKYKPTNNLHLTGSLTLNKKGNSNNNIGSNIFEPYTSRSSDYDNQLLQGTRTSNTTLQLGVNYEIKHNLFIDFDYAINEQKLDLTKANSNYFRMGLRYNMGQQSLVSY